MNLSPYIQLTKTLVLAWTSRLLASGVLSLNLLSLMLEYLTLMPLLTVVIPIASMKLRSAISVRRECKRWNTGILVLLFLQLLEACSTTVACKCLAFLLSCKWKSPYCRVMSWLGFSLLHSAIMCKRDSCSSYDHPFKGHVPASVDLALGEGSLNWGCLSPISFFLFYSVFCRLCFSS